MYDDSHNISSTPCVNVTILDDYFPENDLYITLGLSVASNNSRDVFVGPGKNQTTIKILDDDHSMWLVTLVYTCRIVSYILSRSKFTDQVLLPTVNSVCRFFPVYVAMHPKRFS